MLRCHKRRPRRRPAQPGPPETLHVVVFRGKRQVQRAGPAVLNLKRVTTLKQTAGCRRAEGPDAVWVFKAAAKQRSDCNWVSRRSCCCRRRCRGIPTGHKAESVLLPTEAPGGCESSEEEGHQGAGDGFIPPPPLAVSLTLPLTVAVCTFTLWDEHSCSASTLPFSRQLHSVSERSWLMGRGFCGTVNLNLVVVCPPEQRQKLCWLSFFFPASFPCIFYRELRVNAAFF